MTVKIVLEGYKFSTIVIALRMKKMKKNFDSLRQVLNLIGRVESELNQEVNFDAC